MIRITKLNKYFYHHKSNEIHVINDVSFEFPQTGLVTIIGESGSGKTTLMNVIGGLDDFYKGTIEIDEYKIKKYSSKVMDRIRNEKVGYIFQNYLLLQQRTVYDNLKLVLNMYNITEAEKNERIDYVLKAVGMLKYKKKNVSELSGGQQQRIAIARALIKAPSLILADEPTGNLDEKNTIQIMNIIKKISKNTLVILVSHERKIATSYSDYIIEVSDGKIIKEKALDGKDTYQYEDDQNIYLKEYQYQKIENDVVNIDFYSNDQAKVNLQIIYDKGKFYIKSSNDLVHLDDSSEIKVLDEHKTKLDAVKESMASEYELKALKYVKTPSLSFKEKLNLTFSNLKKLKKRTAVLAFPLIIIVVLALFSIQSVVSASFVDKQHLVYSDSRIYNITLEKGSAEVNTTVAKFGFKKFVKEFMTKNPNIEPLMDHSDKFYFALPNFTQINVQKYELSGFSILTTELVHEEDLIYGRMPQNATEIVVDKWVLENAIENSTISNFMDVSSFVNKTITMRDKGYTFKVVGISANNQNSIYINKWALFDIFPSVLKKNGQTVCSISELEKYLGTNLNIDLDKYEGISSLDSGFPYQTDDLILNGDNSLTIDVVQSIDFGACPYDFALSDEIYEDLLISVLATNFEELKVFCETEEEKMQVADFVEEVSDYYNSGELKATEEFGFTDNIPLTFKDVKLIVSATSDYDNIINPHILEAEKAVTSRILITLTILVISVIIVFFSMKSFAMKNIYDLGVYRALGIKKGSLVFVYALEILIISLRTTLVGGTLCYLITNLIAGIPLIKDVTAISLELYLGVTLGLILINVLVGIIPVMMYMRLTPSKILTKYDV
ncbi:MAG: ABC transporter ATP-binding protein/permease [Bacilli bacterium]|nr:ABC transporter ATP-binding protein/permease [Bacilli bacterium]